MRTVTEDLNSFTWYSAEKDIRYQTNKQAGCIGGRETTQTLRNAESQMPQLIDFFFGGHMKSSMYEVLFASVEDLIARTAVAAGRISDLPENFQKVMNYKHHR
ncbi:hypothetical protein TNCV_3813821 [Trichonephila clavipes]|nr:hypothetical protein TNCV_3813821 [Trichonephila clavipes]